MVNKKQYIHYIIAVILGVVLALALSPQIQDDPSVGLTAAGVRTIAFMVPILYLWLTTNTHWTCLLAMALLVFSGAFVNPDTGAINPNAVWQASMGHFVVITVIAYMILNVALKENGVIDKIAMWFVTRKFVQGKPYAFMAMFFAANIIIGFFVDNISLAVIFIGIAEVLCRNIGLKKGDQMYTVLMLGTLWGNCLLSICSPIAHALPNIIMGMVETATEGALTISYAQWMGFGVIYSIIIFVLMMVVIRIWNPDTSAFKNYDVEAIKAEAKPLGKNGIFTAVIFIIIVFFVLAPSIAKDINPFFGFLNQCGVVVPALLGIVVLAITQFDGKHVLDVPSAFKQVNMPPVIFAGVVSAFAGPLAANANTGISVWLGNVLRPTLGSMNPTVAVIIMIALAIVMTNFLSNTVTQALFFSIGVVILQGSTISLAAFGLIIAIASGMATITPSAAVPSPFFFGPGHLTMKPTLKPNLLFVIICFVVCAFIGLPLANAMIG